MRVAWLLFAKPPILKYVKTRLSKDLNNELALAIYKLCLKWQWENLKAIQHEIILQYSFIKESHIFIFVADKKGISWNENLKYFKDLSLPKIPKLRYVPQATGNLTNRLSDAIHRLKEYDTYIIWGSDIPLLYKYHFKCILEHFPLATLYPCNDGGYASISFSSKDYKKSLFQNIQWSHRNTLKDQCHNLKQLNISYKLLDTLPDLDTGKDILRNILYMEQNKNQIYTNRLLQLNQLLKQFN